MMKRFRCLGMIFKNEYWNTGKLSTMKSSIRLLLVQLNRLKRKSIMLDNLWFWTSDKLTSMKRRLVTSLAMNVARFTPVIKNLHGHNFQSSRHICHSDWKLASDRSKLPDARLKLKAEERPTCFEGVVRLWWKSLLCSRPKSVIFHFGLCPSSLLRKSSTLCCILSDVIRTCGFWRIRLFGCSRQRLR